jgi:energy-converting hydrogenase A subunit I
MDIQKIVSIILLVVTTLAIIYALIIDLADCIVYIIAILGIPLWVLSVGLLTMAKPRKDDKEERIKEPFTGY